MLSAVLESPDDLRIRRIYADWLLERGDPRGELVSVQCQLQELEDVSQRLALRRRERDLLEGYEEAWLAELGLRPGEGVFVGGMVEELSLTAARLLELGPPLGQRTPARCLRLEGELAGLIDALSCLPAFPCLASLRFRRNDMVHPPRAEPTPGDALARLVASSASLGGLKKLYLGYTAVHSDGAIALAESPHLQGLQHLDLQHNRLCDRGALALASSPHLRSLRKLWLSGNQIGEQGVLALTQSPHLADVTHLDLSQNPGATAGTSHRSGART